jgi:hypothetical protein
VEEERDEEGRRKGKREERRRAEKEGIVLKLFEMGLYIRWEF